MKKYAYIVGGDSLVEALFRNYGYDISHDKDKADIAVFTGGADVSPELYGEENVASVCNLQRDEFELEVFKHFLGFNTPMAGICRGGQFLNVVSGGKLWQDVNKHAISDTHIAKDIKNKRLYKVSSTHHQMIIPPMEAELIGIANLSTRKVNAAGEFESEEWTDVEVVWHPKTKALCFQPHPEYSYCPETKDWFFDLINRYIWS